MSGITAADMAEFAAIDEEFMPDLCDIVTPGAPVLDPDGGSTPGTPTTLAGVKCRMAAGGKAAETLIAMRLTDVADNVLAVPVGTPVALNARITKGGATYEVVGSDLGRSYATNLTLALRSIT